jgi:hypothetical protein
MLSFLYLVQILQPPRKNDKAYNFGPTFTTNIKYYFNSFNEAVLKAVVRQHSLPYGRMVLNLYLEMMQQEVIVVHFISTTTAFSSMTTEKRISPTTLKPGILAVSDACLNIQNYNFACGSVWV